MTISNPIIRIVDDEAVIRKALKFLLESEGWAVEAYEKGSEFLVEDRPSLIGCLILDVAMPEMNGLELYQRLRERKYEVPVIFLTGHGDVDMAVQAMKDGATSFKSRLTRRDFCQPWQKQFDMTKLTEAGRFRRRKKRRDFRH